MRIIRLEDMTPADWANMPEPRELTPEELAEAYRLCRESFTAADLQKYTELDEGVPAEELLTELEEMQKQAEQGNS